MAFTIDVFDQKGKKLSTQNLDDTVFSPENINHDLIHQFVRMQQANARTVIASTKNRGEVQGSGKKIYRQKGTGSGRAGEKRSPLRKKGGVVRGPRTSRNFELKMPKKMRKAAMRSALSMKASEDGLLILDSFVAEPISTKRAIQVLESLQLNRSVLVVTNNDGLALLSYRNLPYVDIVDAAYVSVYDVLKAKKVLFVDSAIDVVTSNNKK